jgi:trans-aconitate methyltransferase
MPLKLCCPRCKLFEMRFEDCALEYDRHAAPQRAFAARVFEFAAIGPGERVVELGAGTGAVTRLLCGIPGAQVCATDVSPTMVQVGRAAVPGASWLVVDAFTGPIPRSSAQVSSGLLQWAPDPVRVLERWAAAVEPGGRMIHAFPCDPCLKEWRGIVAESPLVWRDEREWAGIFERAGLRVRRRCLWTEPHYFESAREMLQSMHGSGVTAGARISWGRLRQAMRVYDATHRTPHGVVATWAWMAFECGKALD